MSTILIAACMIGIGYYVWRAARTRTFTRHTAGQILFLSGLLVHIVPQRLYDLPQEALDTYFDVGVTMIVSGLLLTVVDPLLNWRRRRE